MVEGLEWWGSFEAAGVIAVSGWMRSEVISQFKVPPEKVIEIPNGVDIEKFSGPVDAEAFRSKWKVQPGERLITAVGRLTSQKGFDDLIKAYPEIRKAVPRSRLLLMGEGYMRGELESLAEAQQVRGSTTFAGFVSDADVVNALKVSDVVAVPSRFEPFGIVALEAMAGGSPLVVSKVGGLAEIVDDGVDGLEVQPNDPPSLARAAVKVLSDGVLASQLVAKAKEKVKAYDWASSTAKTLEAYERAIAGAKFE
jgi:glycosyltransferase involved in cell wall biosynthesis